MTDIAFSMAQEQIKELRAENERLQAHVESMINAMKADNERLRDENTSVVTELVESEAEIERLREQVDALRLVATSHEPEALCLQAENERLREEVAILRTTEVAEIDRLTAALQGLVDAVTAEVNEKGGGGYILARLSDARRALLEPKP